MTLDRPPVGQWETIIAAFEYADGRESTPQGLPGSYEVTLILGHSSLHIADGQIELNPEGDSFIQFLDPTSPNEQIVTAIIQAATSNGSKGSFIITPNKFGRMAKLSFPNVHARDRYQAEAVAYELARPLLGWLSLNYDIPMDIAQIITKEATTANVGTTLWIDPKIVGRDGRFQLPGPLDAYLVECLQQYQEGNNTTNDFYRFLCMWKTFEGASYVRGLINREITRRGCSLDLSRTSRMPTTEDFPENVRNEKFGKIITLYRDVFRNALAHLDFRRSQFILHNRLEDVRKVREAIPMIRYIARTVLQEEIQAFYALCEACGEVIQLGSIAARDEADSSE